MHIDKDDKSVYYVTKRPGYLIQAFNNKDLCQYNEEYVAKYDVYDKSVDILLNELRVKTLFNVLLSEVYSALDVGYGNGGFLRELLDCSDFKLYGYDVSGVKPPEGVISVTDEEIVSNSYDLVTFFDSLEHIPTRDIAGYLSQIDATYFMISVPWFHESAGSKWFNGWKHRRPNEHLHHFDAHGIMSILNEIGYDILHISNIEDEFRVSSDALPNILTVIAKKRLL